MNVAVVEGVDLDTGGKLPIAKQLAGNVWNDVRQVVHTIVGFHVLLIRVYEILIADHRRREGVAGERHAVRLIGKDEGIQHGERAAEAVAGDRYTRGAGEHL